MAETTTFTESGQHEFTVPSGVEEVEIDVRGGEGADGDNVGGTDGSGGNGGQVTGTLDVTPGETLYAYVSKYGGGSGDPSTFAPSGAGGATSELRQGGDTEDDAVASAGGGGGGAAVGTDEDGNDQLLDGDAGNGGDADESGQGATAETNDGFQRASAGGGGAGSDAFSGGANHNDDFDDTYGNRVFASGGGGGGGGGGAGGAEANDQSDGGYAAAGGGGGGANYVSSAVSNPNTGIHFGADPQVSITVPEPPATPDNVTATYVDDDEVEVSFDENTEDGDPADYFDVQIDRDGTGFVDPTGGDADPTSDGTHSYGPSAGDAYDTQVGADSSFQFRVRAVNSVDESDWVTTSTVHTTPIPPHDPSVSRPDATSATVSWTNESDTEDGVEHQYRRDDGGGYGSWSAHTSSPTTAGDASVDVDLSTDTRDQLRVRTLGPDGKESEWAYPSHGNDGNIYFSDDFESGDLSNWDQTTLDDADSGVTDASNDTLGVDGADEGSDYLRLDSDDNVYQQIGDLSGESDVLIKAAVAVGGMDADGVGLVEFYDGSSWQQLRTLGHEFNRQGWVEVGVAVPASQLSDDNFVRFRADGGGTYAVDRVVVSDVLHEYAKPAAPSGADITAGYQEATVTWTDEAAFESGYETVGVDGDPPLDSDSSAGSESESFTGLRDGETYEANVVAYVRQYRNGSESVVFDSDPVSTGTATTDLPGADSLSVVGVGDTTVALSWSLNSGDLTGVRVYYSTDDGETWTQDDDLAADATERTVPGLLNGEKYRLAVEVFTEDTTTVTAPGLKSP